ncbi:hypothetical protein ACFL5V_08965 [Fibrobacterota bacterium]
MMNFKVFIAAFILILAFRVRGNPSRETKQKIYIYLKEPLREEVVSIRFNNRLSNTVDFEAEEDLPVAAAPLYKIIYNSGKQAKRTISLVLPRPGTVKLEAFDFYGKHLGTLHNGFCSMGNITLEEKETWKSFVKFRGIAFLILSMDGKVVVKELFPKVD